MRRALLAALLLPAALGCGGPLLGAELSIPEVRITLPSQDFPGSPVPLGGSVAAQIHYDLGAQLPEVTQPGVNYDLKLKRLGIALSAASPGADLSCIQSARITVLAPGGVGSSVVVASYTRDDAAPPPNAIEVAGDSGLDLQPYVAAGRLDARVELVYDAVNPPFAADVSAAFSIAVKVDWTKYL